MPVAEIGGRPLSYLRQGSGSPLLLIQGMAGHTQMWGAPLLDALASDYDIVAFDHRGIGESADVEGEFSVEDLADDAAQLLDVLGWSDAHVFGFSLGGMVAQELTLKFPRRVRTLVLACTYAGGEGSDISAPGPLAMFEAMRSGNIDTAIRAAFEANLSPAYTADESHYPAFKTASLGVQVKVPTVLRQAQAAVAHDTSARLAEITVPTLILHGTQDQMIPYRNAAMLERLIPNARLHTFDGVGHLIWWERPDETVRLIREHCRP